MVAVAGFDFVLLDTEHGPADVVELRAHIAFAEATACRCWSGSGRASRRWCCGRSTPARRASSRRTSTPPSRPPRWSTRLLPAARAPRVRDVRAARVASACRPARAPGGRGRDAGARDDRVPGGVRQAAGDRHRSRASTGSWSGSPISRAASTETDPPHAEQVREVHGCWPAGLVPDGHRREPAAARRLRRRSPAGRLQPHRDADGTCRAPPAS